MPILASIPGRSITAGIFLFNLSLGILLLTRPGHAAETALSFADEARLADLIVHVRVDETSVEETAEGWIFTTVEHVVIETLSGYEAPRFTTRVIGGKVGDHEISSPIGEVFSRGREYVLLLGATTELGHRTVSPAGIVPVRRDPRTQAAVVSTPRGLQRMLHADGTPYRNLPSTVPLPDFLTTLRTLAEAAR